MKRANEVARIEHKQGALEVARGHPLLSVLAPERLQLLFDQSLVRQLGARRTILKEGDAPDSAYVLLSGSVRVFHREGDTEVLLKLFRAPALFGEMEVMTARPYVEYVVTLEPSDLLVIHAPVFLALLDDDRPFAGAVARDLAARLCVAAHNIRALAFGNVQARLAHLLLDYAELFGAHLDDGEEIRLGLSISQEMMAKDLAVSRNAINDALLELKKRRLIDKRDARYVLLSPTRLRGLSTGTLPVAFTSGDRRRRREGAQPLAGQPQADADVPYTGPDRRRAGRSR